MIPVEEQLKALYDRMQRYNVVDAFKQLQRVPPKLNPDIITSRALILKATSRQRWPQ